MILKYRRLGETYNIRSGSERTNLLMVEGLCAVVDNLRLDGASYIRSIEFIEDRSSLDRCYATDECKLRGESSYAPAYSFEKGLNETAE